MTGRRGPHPTERLAQLIRDGLRFADVIPAFAQHQSARERAYLATARELWHGEGTLEIDEDSIVGGSDDDGAYVLAWVWVSAEAAGLSPVEPDDEPVPPGPDTAAPPAARELGAPAAPDPAGPAPAPTSAPRCTPAHRSS